MDNSQKYLDPQILSSIEGLELKARLIVEGYLSGLHKSPHHGFSVEFAQHREYVPGDDLRYLDWKVYGRSDRYYLKQFEAETNFACHILVDTSDSMSYCSSSAAISKLEYARYVAAAISYLVVKQRDAVGLCTFDSKVQQRIPAGSQSSHLQNIIHILEDSSPEGETAIGPIMHDLSERIKKRGLVIVISDFFDDVDSLLLGLKHFRHRRHDVSLIQIVDPAEQDFPFEDPTLFQGLEHFPDLGVNTRALRPAYLKQFEDFLFNLRRGARELGMEHMLVRTDQPLDQALTNYLACRERFAAH